MASSFGERSRCLFDGHAVMEGRARQRQAAHAKRLDHKARRSVGEGKFSRRSSVRVDPHNCAEHPRPASPPSGKSCT